MRRKVERHVPHCSAILSMAPHVINTVLPSRANRPALRQVEKHLGLGVLGIQHHEDDAVRRVAGPVLSRMCRVARKVRVHAPAKGRDGLTDIGILVDADEVCIAEDLDSLVRCVREIRPNDQWRLEQRPCCEVALGFVVGEVTDRIALARVADFHDVHIVVSVEVVGEVAEAGLVDYTCDAAPPWFDIAVDAPRLRDARAP